MAELNKEHLDIIKALNKHLGTHHRSTPYDLTKDADLKQALTMAVAAYADYSHYLYTLDALIEDFDESLEHYDTTSWFFMGNKNEKADSMALECASSLNEAASAFSDIESRSRENLELLMKVVLTAPTATQTEILCRAYSIKPRDLQDCFEELFEMLTEAPYHHPIPDNFKTFLDVVKETWEEFEA